MDIKETKQKIVTEKNGYRLEYNYSCNNYNCKVNGIEIICPHLLHIYIRADIKINKGIGIVIHLNIENENQTIAKFHNIDITKLYSYDFDEELLNNLEIIINDIENSYNNN